MLAWMLYVVMVTLLLSIGAFIAERAARLKRGRTRWIWITAIVASLAIPTVIASVSVQLPNEPLHNASGTGPMLALSDTPATL